MCIFISTNVTELEILFIQLNELLLIKMDLIDKNKLFQELFKAWKLAYPSKTAACSQKDTTKYWNSNKSSLPTIRQKILNLKSLALNSQRSIVHIFNNVSTPPAPEANDVEVIGAPQVNAHSEASHTNECSPGATAELTRPSPAQEKLKSDIAKNTALILALQQAKATGIATPKQIDDLKETIKAKVKLDKKLQKLKRNAVSSKKIRDSKRQKLEQLKISHPEASKELEGISRECIGRPRIEEHQPMLLKYIVDIFTNCGAADPRRRTEVLRGCMTLNDLQTELNKEGFQLSRSALYLRLVPRNSNTIEGKRHVHTVPVKLVRAQNEARKSHEDSHFGNAAIKYLKDLANIFGDNAAFVLSQDDKARIAMGLPAANKQAPILMHMEYVVKLPDHDYVVAPKHKLIPSVYAGLTFKNGQLSYSGPTYISIRSGKHDKSASATHAQDLNTLIETEGFKNLAKCSGAREIKPIFIIFTDGGPDENPRFPNTLIHAADTFAKFDLDAIFVATHAPGQSAYNQVERRMAPLSRDLSGVILPHDYYGSHLNENGKTCDPVLELKNFEKAGETLASIWNDTVIDSYPVEAHYVGKNGNTEVPPSPDEKWKAIHVRQSRYVLQIVKCKNQSCCKPHRTNIADFLLKGFLPAPVKFKQLESGITICSRDDTDCDGRFGDLTSRLALQRIPSISTQMDSFHFDHYCPSLKETLAHLTCKVCKVYFASQAACKKHQIVHRPRSNYYLDSNASIQDVEGQEDLDYQEIQNEEDGEVRVLAENNQAPDIEIIEDLGIWLCPPFDDVD